MSFTESLEKVVSENSNCLLGKHSSWERLRLGDAVEILNGFPFASSGFSKTAGMPLLRIRDVGERSTEALFDGPYTDEFIVRSGDIVVGMDGDFRIAEWHGPEALLNQRVCKLTPDEQIVRKRFLLYALPGYLDAIHARTSSVTVKHLSSKTIADIPLPLPPLKEQDRIVAELENQFTRIDAGIRAFKRVQTQLKRYRASVLKSACEGRLVPTEAELARRERRDYEPADKLLARILKERRARWEAEQLAKITEAGKSPKDDKWKAKYTEPNGPPEGQKTRLPEGWTWTTLGQAFRIGVGATPSRAEPRFWNGSIPWVSSGEVSFCRIRATRELITEEGLANSSTEIHPKGSILLGMIGEGKTRGQVAILEIAACNNQNSAAIRVSEAGLSPEYVYRYLEGQYDQTRRVGAGNNQQALNKGRVEAMSIPLPPLSEQRRIALEVERLLSNVDSIEAIVASAITRSNKMRQSILRQTLDGLLVPQDPREEPASKLLERIATSVEKKTSRRGQSKNTNSVTELKAIR